MAGERPAWLSCAVLSCPVVPVLYCTLINQSIIIVGETAASIVLFGGHIYIGKGLKEQKKRREGTRRRNRRKKDRQSLQEINNMCIMGTVQYQ